MKRMKGSWLRVRRFVWTWMVLSSPVLGWLLTSSAAAQIVPDSTLGAESSQVLLDAEEDSIERIVGGASRGSNLFHSFAEFNVGELQSVYFVNPAGIDAILSRVTGENVSNIFGTLGVEGAADLFFINPNGIVFGENAALDIEGSFYATTGSAIALGSDTFSATNPEQDRLVSVRPGVLFEDYLNDASGDITSTGQISANGILSLAAQQIDLQGQVAAGSDLTLLGLKGVSIQDTADTPFIGFAGGNLQIQGNQQVDIVALSHADSGLFSYGDMVLASSSPVNGDAHYLSGGDFRVETLDGEAGSLKSPIDPIIRTLGDVVIGEYEGASLHILAGGSVDIGTATINAPDPGGLGIDFLRETVTLSDGTVVEIDGGTQPTLDVRAGVDPEAIGTPPLQLQTGFDVGDEFDGTVLHETAVPSSADITIGDGYIDAPDGLILLTTQYQPNNNVEGGGIFVMADKGIFGDGLDARGFGEQGGAIYLDSRQNIEAVNSFISNNGVGELGDIVLLASEDIIFDSQDDSETGIFSRVEEGGNGIGGEIRLRATNLSLENGSQIVASLSGNGRSGDINIEVSDNVALVGSGRSEIENDVRSSAVGSAGDISIRSDTLLLQDGAIIGAVASGVGDTGDINIITDGDIRVEGLSDTRFTTLILNRVSGEAEGEGGDINISSGGSFLMTNAAQISAITEGLGDSGDVLIEARDNVSLINSSIFTEVSDGEVSGSAGGIGDAGDITIRTGNLLLSDGSQLRLDTENEGNAGNAFIFAEDSITITGEGPGSGPNRAFIVSSAISSTVEEDAVGEGGNIDITTGRLEINDGFISTQTLSQGGAGNITIVVDSLNANDGAQVSASTSGTGNSGLILIDAQGDVVFQGRDSSDFPSGLFSGIEGNVDEAQDRSSQGIKVTARSLVISDRAQFSSSTGGNGDAGDIIINVSEDLSLSDSLIIAEVSENVGRGSGGNIIINAGVLELANGSFLLADTENVGDAGSILIETSEGITLSGRDSDNTPSQITATVEGSAVGEGGNIDIATGILEITDGAFIETSTAGRGSAGNIAIDVNSLTATGGAFISAISLSANSAGDIDIQTDRLELFDSDIKTSATQSSGGNIGVNALNSELSGIIILRGDSDITTDSAGDGGNINLNSITIAFEDSDIITRSTDQSGGDIAIGPFFSQTLPVDRVEPFDGDGRVDVNLDGPLSSGQLLTPDTTFVLNSLNELSAALPPVESLTAGSCIDRARAEEGGSSFTIAGAESVPQQPGNSTISRYPTGSPQAERVVQTIQEPENAYQLADGRWVLSHDCEQ